MEQYIAWTQAVGIDSSCVDPQFVLKNRKVCHAHFEEKFLTWTRRLGAGAIPTLLLPVDGEVKEFIKHEHSYAASRNYNGELQKEDTIVDDTTLNAYENGVDTTQVVLTKLIESYNIEETCYSDAERLLSHLDVAEVTEIASTAENKDNIASQDQNEIRKTLHKSEDISDCNLSSCNDLSSDKEECQNINTKNSVSTATTKYTENIKTCEMHHVLDDANANKANKSSAGFRRNRKYLYYPIQSKSGRSAIISKQEISKISTLRKNRSVKASLCFDKYYVSKESQANINQIKPLLINSMSSFNTQSNRPYEQSVSFDFAPFKYRAKVLSASLLLNLENKDHNSLKFGGYNANDLHQLGGKHSLQQSGCNTHFYPIGKESVIEICEQANPGSRSIPNELCLSDIHNLDNVIQQPLCTSPDRHVSVTIYEENCVNRAGPVSPKPAKLHVSELDQYVGSTTFVSGVFEPNYDEPVEDPLAIHSPHLGIKDCMCSVENITNVVEDHNVSYIEVEENKSNIEDNMSDIEDNMSTVEDNMSTVEDNMSTVEDNMSTVEDNMSTVEDNLSNVEDNMSTVEDNMSFKKDSRHLLDSFVDRDYDDLDLRLEIAYALKFKYQEGKTSKEAVEEIIEKYGRGKLSLEEAKCWYSEFNLENSIMRIIFSGGPIYK